MYVHYESSMLKWSCSGLKAVTDLRGSPRTSDKTAGLSFDLIHSFRKIIMISTHKITLYWAGFLFIVAEKYRAFFENIPVFQTLGNMVGFGLFNIFLQGHLLLYI
jgi:hypothetical protein